SFFLSKISGSTQCLQVDTNGEITGTGSACGTGGSNWSFGTDESWIRPSSTAHAIGIFANASSSIDANFRVDGGATTTDSFHAGGQITANGDINASTNGASLAVPRVFGYKDLSANEAARFQFGDEHNALQNAFANDVNLYSYWGLVLTGGRQNFSSGFNAMPFSKTLDFGVLVMSDTIGTGFDGGSSGNPITTLGIQATTSQWANLTAWATSTGATLSLVDYLGHFVIGDSATSTYTLKVVGETYINGNATTTGSFYVGNDLMINNNLEVTGSASTTVGLFTQGDLHIGGNSTFDGTGHDSFSDFVDAEHLNWKNSVDTIHIDNYIEGHGDGTDCGVGEYPLGVDAVGAVKSCTDATTEINSVVNGLGGNDLTCSGQSCDVDDSFLQNDVADMGVGLTLNSATSSDTFYLPNLGIAAGTRLAVDVNGLIIATTTPASHNAVTLAGQDYLTISGQVITAGEIEPDDLASSDFGGFDCNGTTCTIDDLFLKNSADDTTAFGITMRSATTTDSFEAGGYASSTLGLFTQGSGHIGGTLTIDTALAVTSGGLGVATLADGGILLGSGTGAVTVLPRGGNGVILIGEDGSDPSMANITETGDAIVISNGAASIDFAVHAALESIADSSYTGDDAITTVGTIGTGTWNALFAAGLIDGDDINSNIAGTNLTLTAGSPDVLNLDPTISLTGLTMTNGTSTDSFVIPQGASPDVDAAGEIALDTTDDQLLIGTGAGTLVVIPTEIVLFSVIIPSTSPDFISGGVIHIPKWTKDGRDISQYRCHVDGGTSVVANTSDDGTNDTESITCATTQTSDTDVATNSTFNADELWRLEIGTITGTVDYLIFEAYGFITRE
ncbi:hypothetical protein LCGC14_1415970, partial [marine sediment metagenome]